MQLFKRPEEPSDFQGAVKAYRKKVYDFYKKSPAKRKKNSDGGKKIKLFVEKWKDYKHKFAEAQWGKCGYCEMMVIGGQPGDVEHYFPKGEVWKLTDNPDEWGKEKPWLSTVEGRRREVVCEQGYWWLAYDWHNYLLACTVCNQYWKLSYFPIEEEPRKKYPQKGFKETPLLLNPFDETRLITQHLKFNDMGQIESYNKSRYGFETIRTCGLDRFSLMRSREEKARKIFKNIYDLNNTNDKKRTLEILNDILELGNSKNVHSGMVRVIFEQQTGTTWDELGKLVSR